MTAFLYIAPTSNLAPTREAGRAVRRVDFGNIASLFTADSEPPPRASRVLSAVRFVAAALFLLLAVGDTVLFARPDTLTFRASLSQPAFSSPGRLVSL